jgi:hypothetical protein
MMGTNSKAVVAMASSAHSHVLTKSAGLTKFVSFFMFDSSTANGASITYKVCQQVNLRKTT